MDEIGRFTGLLSLAQDVTARVESEKSQRLLERAIRAVTQGIVITDPSRPYNPGYLCQPGLRAAHGLRGRGDGRTELPFPARPADGPGGDGPGCARPLSRGAHLFGGIAQLSQGRVALLELPVDFPRP